MVVEAGTGGPGSIVVDSSSMLASAVEFTAMADHLEAQLDKAMEAVGKLQAPGYPEKNLRIKNQAGMALLPGWEFVRHYRDLSTELMDAIADAIAVDQLEFSFDFSLRVDNRERSGDNPDLRLLQQGENDNFEELGLVDVELSTDQADRFAEIMVNSLSERTDLSEEEIRVMVATQMNQAGIVTNGDRWLGAILSESLFDSTPTVEVAQRVAPVVASDENVALSFYQNAGATNTASLPALLIPTGPLTSSPTISLALDEDDGQTMIRHFASGLARATSAGDVGFTGEDLMTVNTQRDRRPGLVTSRGYLFDTSEVFDSDFVVSAGAYDMRERASTRMSIYGNDQGTSLILAAVVNSGPETTAALMNKLGDDAGVFFRSLNQIDDFDDSAGDITARVFESLAQSERYGPRMVEFIIYHAGSSTEPLNAPAAKVTAAWIGETLLVEPERLVMSPEDSPTATGPWNRLPGQNWSTAQPPLQETVDAIASTYRGGDRSLVGVEYLVVGNLTKDAWTENRELTDDEEQIVGTALGVLTEGRFVGDLEDGRSLDEANALNGRVFSALTGTAVGLATIGASPVVGIPLGVIGSDASSQVAGKLFPTNNAAEVQGAWRNSSNTDFLWVDYVVATQLASEGKLYNKFDGIYYSVEVEGVDLEAVDRPKTELVVLTDSGNYVELAEWIDTLDIHEILGFKERVGMNTREGGFGQVPRS